MKKLIILLLFIPLVSFGQDEVTVVQSKTSVSTNVENDLVLSDEKTTIKTPLTADLSNYTHLLLVKVSVASNKGSGYQYGGTTAGMKIKIQNGFTYTTKKFYKVMMKLEQLLLEISKTI